VLRGGGIKAWFMKIKVKHKRGALLVADDVGNAVWRVAAGR
jgi:hypothetical protein